MNQNTIVEVWKDVPNYEGYYQASSFGRIKSLFRIEQRSNRLYKRKEFICKPHLGGKDYKKKNGGYLYLSLFDHKNTSIHRLVAMAFYPNADFNLHVDHINSIRLDNRPENLQWVTVQQNNEKQKHSLGEDHSNSKLTTKDIKHIRDEYDKLCNIKKKGALEKISKGYKINKTTVFYIVKRKSWKHVC